MADKLIVLNGGVIEQEGRPLDIYRRPASTFVAAFIGSPPMNLLDARIEGGRAMIGGSVVAEGIAVADRAVTLGIRPEDLEPAHGGLEFAVGFVEEMGAERLAHGTCDGQAVIVTLPPDHPLGDRMHLAAPRDRVHLFDAGTGARLGE
ncbi:MAG TPA: TOBE domain-containing protein, partial [Paracoccaceae bacterium]|nr:TOBE domain-containing protein [Paracoccaceae bacterium]